MSQNISLMGNDYAAVPGILLPKTGGGTAYFSDTSPTTATASDVASGKIFFLADGTQSTGTSSGGGGASNIVQGTFTTGATGNTTGTFSIGYTGSGYPIAMMIYVDGGAYNNSTGGNTDWYNSVVRYDVGAFYMTKARIPTTPTYSTSGGDNYGVVAIIYKNSTSTATTYTRTSSMTVNQYSSSNGAASTACARFKGNGKTVSYYIGNGGSSTIGFAKSTKYAYIVVYSS